MITECRVVCFKCGKEYNPKEEDYCPVCGCMGIDEDKTIYM